MYLGALDGIIQGEMRHVTGYTRWAHTGEMRHVTRCTRWAHTGGDEACNWVH